MAANCSEWSRTSCGSAGRDCCRGSIGTVGVGRPARAPSSARRRAWGAMTWPLANSWTLSGRYATATRPRRQSQERRRRLPLGPSLERAGTRETALVPLRHFACHDAANRAVVLGEGEPDAKMAVRMARYFAHTRGLERLLLHHRVDAGGGQGTSGALRRYREDPRFCICVVDSDRTAPGSNEGRTAAAAKREIDDAKPWVARHVIACREMENTLPRGLMEAACGGDHQKRRALDDMERFDEGGALARYREYCDFKHGTRLEWVLRLANEDARRFWLGPEAPLTAALADPRGKLYPESKGAECRRRLLAAAATLCELSRARRSCRGQRLTLAASAAPVPRRREHPPFPESCEAILLRRWSPRSPARRRAIRSPPDADARVVP